MLSYLKPVFRQARVLTSASKSLGNLEVQSSRSYATKIVDNVIHSPHADCPLPTMTIFQNLCQTAMRFPNNVAVVSFLVKLPINSDLIASIEGVWIDGPQVHVRSAVSTYSSIRQLSDSNGLQTRRCARSGVAQHPRVPVGAVWSSEYRHGRLPHQPNLHGR